MVFVLALPQYSSTPGTTPYKEARHDAGPLFSGAKTGLIREVDACFENIYARAIDARDRFWAEARGSGKVVYRGVDPQRIERGNVPYDRALVREIHALARPDTH